MRRRRHALPDAHTAGGAFLGGKPLSPLWRLGKSGDAAVFGETLPRKRTARARSCGMDTRRNAAHGRVTYRGMRRGRTGSAHAPTSLPQCGQYFPRKGRAFPQCGHRLLQSLYTAPASMTT